MNSPEAVGSTLRASAAVLVVSAVAGSGLAPGGSLNGQVIPVKTVPLATGDQFLVHPSRRMGMGGVSLALDDPEGDPFSNPAKAARVGDSRILGTPTYYSVSDDNGSARTLPVSVLLSSDGAWSGGASLGLQEIRGPEPPTGVWPVRIRAPVDGRSSPTVLPPDDFRSLEEGSARNLYVTGVLARRLSGGWAFGMALSRAELEAVDGVEHLFAGSTSLEQDATMTDYRVGVIRDGDVGTLEAVLLHRRFDASYRVGRVAWVAPEDPSSCDPALPCGQWEIRTEANPDRTRTTGLQLGWIHRLDGSPWMVGTTAAINYKDHPKIPNYEIMNIPRDPGTTWAWNAGLGIGRTDDAGEYGVDLVIEPVRSETWAVAEEEVERAGGGLILPGERTVENDFDFGNVRLRLGGSRRFGAIRGDLGLQVYSVSYDLVQEDRVAVVTRHEDESWIEWSPTWGVSIRLGGVDVSYLGRATVGTGRPATFSGAVPTLAMSDRAAGIDFLPAPRGPLALDAAHVTTHRLGVRVPLE